MVLTPVLSSDCILTHGTPRVLRISAPLLRAELQASSSSLLHQEGPVAGRASVGEGENGGKKSRRGFRESPRRRIHHNFTRICEQKHKFLKKGSQISVSKSANRETQRERKRERDNKK